MKCANLYYGLTIKDLKKLAYEFALKIGIKYPPQWNNNLSAGKKWYRGFVTRHSELSLRKPEHTSLYRVKGFCRKNVDAFFG